MKSIFSIGLSATKLTPLAISSITVASSAFTGITTALICKACESSKNAVELETLRGVVKRQFYQQEKIDWAEGVIDFADRICKKYDIVECKTE